MIHAYQEIYLSKSQQVLGDAFDYAINFCHIPGDDFIKLFLVSSISKKIEEGDVNYILGKSGIDIVLEIVKETTGKVIEAKSIESINRSKEYWILDDLVGDIDLNKSLDKEALKNKAHNNYPIFTDYDRAFPSFTFALATGVGKTRLMGAFITYLYTRKNIKNFLVVAPSLTIYNKLINDFANSSSSKYVFNGVGCFEFGPHVISGDEYRKVNFGNFSDVKIFVYNAQKFNSNDENRRFNSLNEVLGKSFFDYLSELDDLVVLMDEAHHYRNNSTSEALDKIKPVLGLELTATPQVISGKKVIPFKNVVIDYPLALSIKDGYTRTPYALTRNNIEQYKWGDEQLDKIMINDDLLNGQISVVGLENDGLFDRFTELFRCDKDKISCALLTFGDYSRVEKGWRYSFGINDSQSWRMIFHQSSAARFDDTKRCLVQLLSSSQTFDNTFLDNTINAFITNCKSNSLYEWRYYFIKYSIFRPNKFGKYWIKAESKYCMYALWTQQKVSENAFQPYLKEIDATHLDSEKYGQRLVVNGQYIYCEKDRFVLKDKDNNEIKALVINQNADNVDTEDRIAKYLAYPLV